MPNERWMAAIPRYRGPFREKQAERLLWRAGFGPKPGEAKRLARGGLNRAVASLLDPPRPRLRGPKPVDGDGLPIAPYDLWGHDALWWLDKMVRSNRPLAERMALNWHDWFATGDVGSQRRSIRQTELFRRRALDRFDQLLLDVTRDEAMLVWLSGIDNNKWSPNENYARELMELFTLGASDESGYPYSEDDVREQARALTGWRADWVDDVGLIDFRYDPGYHDGGMKTIFGKTGRFDWRDSCRLCLEHRAHAGYLVDKLWSYFIPVPAPATTRSRLIALYKRQRYAIKPLLEAILKHPLLYEGPAMVKPPIVYIAGMLRARRRGVDTDGWTWVSDLAGQRPFAPPNVAGWDEERWLDTSSYRGRWIAASYVTREDEITDDGYDSGESPAEALDRALRYWGNPTIGAATRDALVSFGREVEGVIVGDWQESTYRALRQNALRQLLATSPDMQTC
jgi:Protein of unknown function (DUF1800)